MWTKIMFEADSEMITALLDQITHFCKAAILECHADMILDNIFNG